MRYVSPSTITHDHVRPALCGTSLIATPHLSRLPSLYYNGRCTRPFYRYLFHIPGVFRLIVHAYRGNISTPILCFFGLHWHIYPTFAHLFFSFMYSSAYHIFISFVARCGTVLTFSRRCLVFGALTNGRRMVIVAHDVCIRIRPAGVDESERHSKPNVLILVNIHLWRFSFSEPKCETMFVLQAHYCR
jgi:hypothetical protein